MRRSILASAMMVLLFPVSALAAVTPDRHSSVPAALSVIPPDRPVISTAAAQSAPVMGPRLAAQPTWYSQPQTNTKDAHTVPATRVHIFWFFGGR